MQVGPHNSGNTVPLTPEGNAVQGEGQVVGTTQKGEKVTKSLTGLLKSIALRAQSKALEIIGKFELFFAKKLGFDEKTSSKHFIGRVLHNYGEKNIKNSQAIKEILFPESTNEEGISKTANEHPNEVIVVTDFDVRDFKLERIEKELDDLKAKKNLTPEEKSEKCEKLIDENRRLTEKFSAFKNIAQLIKNLDDNKKIILKDGELQLVEKKLGHEKIGNKTIAALVFILDALSEAKEMGITHIKIDGEEIPIENLKDNCLKPFGEAQLDEAKRKNGKFKSAIHNADIVFDSKYQNAIDALLLIEDLEAELFSEGLKEAKELVDKINDLQFEAKKDYELFNKNPESLEGQESREKYHKKISEADKLEYAADPDLYDKMERVRELKGEIRKIEKDEVLVGEILDFLEAKLFAQKQTVDRPLEGFESTIKNPVAQELAAAIQNHGVGMLAGIERGDLRGEGSSKIGELGNFQSELADHAMLKLYGSQNVEELSENIINLVEAAYLLAQRNDFANAAFLFTGVNQLLELAEKKITIRADLQKKIAVLQNLIASGGKGEAAIKDAVLARNAGTMQLSIILKWVAGGAENVKLSDKLNALAFAEIPFFKAKKLSPVDVEQNNNIEKLLEQTTRNTEYKQKVSFTEADIQKSKVKAQERYEGNRDNYKGKDIQDVEKETIQQDMNAKIEKEKSQLRKDFKKRLGID